MAEQKKQIEIKATDADLKGLYSNLALISHSKEEFVMDFINLIGDKGILLSRIITSPSHAKRLALAINDNIEKYEEKFGAIEASEQKHKQEEIGFKPYGQTQ